VREARDSLSRRRGERRLRVGMRSAMLLPLSLPLSGTLPHLEAVHAEVVACIQGVAIIVRGVGPVQGGGPGGRAGGEAGGRPGRGPRGGARAGPAAVAAAQGRLAGAKPARPGGAPVRSLHAEGAAGSGW